VAQITVGLTEPVESVTSSSILEGVQPDSSA
jgi:hypothetical protein